MQASSFVEGLWSQELEGVWRGWGLFIATTDQTAMWDRSSGRGRDTKGGRGVGGKEGENGYKHD